MKTCLRKTDEATWELPLSKRTPPFQLTPLFLSNFFITHLFVQISKTRNPPNFKGGGSYAKNLRKSLILNGLCLVLPILDSKSSL